MDTLASAAQSIYVYDLEAYPNYFLALFKRLGTDDYDTLVIEDTASQEDNEQAVTGLFELVTRPDTWLIGYNSFRFDDTILRYIFREQVCHAERIFEFATRVLAS